MVFHALHWVDLSYPYSWWNYFFSVFIIFALCQSQILCLKKVYVFYRWDWLKINCSPSDKCSRYNLKSVETAEITGFSMNHYNKTRSVVCCILWMYGFFILIKLCATQHFFLLVVSQISNSFDHWKIQKNSDDPSTFHEDYIPKEKSCWIHLQKHWVKNKNNKTDAINHPNNNWNDKDSSHK